MASQLLTTGLMPGELRGSYFSPSPGLYLQAQSYRTIVLFRYIDRYVYIYLDLETDLSQNIFEVHRALWEAKKAVSIEQDAVRL